MAFAQPSPGFNPNCKSSDFSLSWQKSNKTRSESLEILECFGDIGVSVTGFGNIGDVATLIFFKWDYDTCTKVVGYIRM
jgi:hypothetical protein